MMAAVAGWGEGARARNLAAALASAMIEGVALASLLGFHGAARAPLAEARAVATFRVDRTPPPRGAAPRPMRLPPQAMSAGPRAAPMSVAPDVMAPDGPAAPPVIPSAPEQAPRPPEPPPTTPDKARPALPDQAYVHQLWQRIQAHRPAATDLAGSVEVLFELDREGKLLSARVGHSDGIILLERAALRAVRSAAPFPAPPHNERGSFSVTVNFGP